MSAKSRTLQNGLPPFFQTKRTGRPYFISFLKYAEAGRRFGPILALAEMAVTVAVLRLVAWRRR